MTRSRPPILINRLGRVAALAWILVANSAFATEWQSTLSKEPPGKFPALRPLRATYGFGWSGFTAATGDIHFTRVPQERHCLLEGIGHTVGLVRALWKYDVNLRATADSTTLRPVDVNQSETTRGKKTVTTTLAFSSAGVSRGRTETGSTATNKPKQFALTNLYDLHSAMLYLRSQPLKDHTTYRVAVYPTTNAYVATLTVLGHEKISVRAGSYNAIKLDVQLSKVGKDMALEPHKKFKRATVWISDDNDRVIVRIEAQIFVGVVFAELQSIQFEATKG